MAAESDKRQVQMSLDLSGEQVLIERATYDESLGQPFEMKVDIIAAHGEVDLLPHMGKPVAVHLYEDDELMRHFHGLITAGEFIQESGAGFHYQLTAHPFTYALSRNTDMAIFQKLTVPKIIKKVLEAAGVNDFKMDKLSKTYQTREYCVQYEESDFTFITRLMEEEGIYYYWHHDADKHTMMFCDTPSAHQPGTPASLEFNPGVGSMVRGGSAERGGTKHYLEGWGERVHSGFEGQVTRRAFDIDKPERPLQGTHIESEQHPGDNREIYSYPNRFTVENIGMGQSEIELEAERRNRQNYAGRTQATSLAVGTKVSVTKHPAGRLNQSYLIVRCSHKLQNEQYRTDESVFDDPDDDESTRVVFEAIPADTPFHIPLTTERPTVKGLESAIVSGPDGEEIYTDKYGRVKVRFHWDRADTTGENSTCWVRVAQFGGLGNIILPRIGQEVMVDFLHGDPDDPVVVGWVFNAQQMPVYPLPDNKTRALWRTKSYMHGTSLTYSDAKELDTKNPGANELRFEDKSGHEEVFLHAEKDMNLRSRNDQTNHVGHNQTEKVFWDREAYVGRNETTEIEKNQKLTINTGDQTEELKQGSRKVTIDQGNDALEVKMGNMSIKCDLGKIEIEAMQSITLTVGQSKVTIDQMGVKIEGMMLKSEAQIMLDTKGTMITQQGSAMHTIKGGIVMIN